MRSGVIYVILATILSHFFTISVPIYVLTVYDKVIPYASINTLFSLTAVVVIFLTFDFATKAMRANLVTGSAGQIDEILSEIIRDKLKSKYFPNEQLSFMRSLPFLSRATDRYREIWAGNNILTIISKIRLFNQNSLLPALCLIFIFCFHILFFNVFYISN